MGMMSKMQKPNRSTWLTRDNVSVITVIGSKERVSIRMGWPTEILDRSNWWWVPRLEKDEQYIKVLLDLCYQHNPEYSKKLKNENETWIVSPRKPEPLPNSQIRVSAQILNPLNEGKAG